MIPPVFKDCQISRITSTQDLGAAVKGHKKNLSADILDPLGYSNDVIMYIMGNNGLGRLYVSIG
jgi:hypothetical protein